MLSKYELALRQVSEQVDREDGVVEITKQLSKHSDRDKLIIDIVECLDFINKGLLIINFEDELLSVEVNKEELEQGAFYKNVEYSIFYGKEEMDDIVESIRLSLFPMLVIGIDNIKEELFRKGYN